MILHIAEAELINSAVFHQDKIKEKYQLVQKKALKPSVLQTHILPLHSGGQ